MQDLISSIYFSKDRIEVTTHLKSKIEVRFFFCFLATIVLSCNMCLASSSSPNRRFSLRCAAEPLLLTVLAIAVGVSGRLLRHRIKFSQVCKQNRITKRLSFTCLMNLSLSFSFLLSFHFLVRPLTHSFFSIFISWVFRGLACGGWSGKLR